MRWKTTRCYWKSVYQTSVVSLICLCSLLLYYDGICILAVFMFELVLFSGTTPSLTLLRSFSVSAQREGYSRSSTPHSWHRKSLPKNPLCFTWELASKFSASLLALLNVSKGFCCILWFVICIFFSCYSIVNFFVIRAQQVKHPLGVFGRLLEMGRASPTYQCAICNSVALCCRVCQCPGDPHRYEVHHRQSCADTVVDRTFQRSAARRIQHIHKAMLLMEGTASFAPQLTHDVIRFGHDLELPLQRARHHQLPFWEGSAVATLQRRTRTAQVNTERIV